MENETNEKLTVKQERFAQRFLEHGNASAAYRECYATDGWTDNAISVEAHKVLNNPKVSLRVKQLEELQLKRHEVTADRVIVELAKLAFLDIRKAFDNNGDLKALSDMDDDTAAAIAGVEFEEVFEMQGQGRDRERVHVGRIHKIKLSDKRGSLELLGKNLKLFTDKVDSRVQQLDKNGDPTDPVGTTVLIAKDSLATALENVKNGKARGEQVERSLEQQRTGAL